MNTYNNSVVVKFVTKVNGNAGVLTPVTVYLTGTTTKANLFSPAGDPIDNPVFTNSTGNYTFDIEDGTYDIVINEGFLSVVRLDKQQIAAVQTQSIITASYDNLQVAKQANITTGAVITTAGYYAANDGGAGQYIVVAGGTGTDDGGSYLDMVNGNQLELIVKDSVNINQYGAISDGVTNDATTLINALLAGNIVDINKNSKIELTNSQAITFFENINSINFNTTITVDILGGIISLSNRVLMSNPTFQNLIIKGIDEGSVEATGLSQTGSAKNHAMELTVSNASLFNVGSFALITVVSGTDYIDVIRGCWEVLSKTASTVTVKNTANMSWPSMTLTSATVWPMNTILRWPVGLVGLGITSVVNSISNVVLDGSWDITVNSPSDGPADGLQVGTSPNTPETGLNESEQTNVGSVWMQRIGIVKWVNNGTQITGKLYGTDMAVCSNGWRGLQSVRNGFIGAKKSAASGNGASGYETEEGGFLLGNDSVAAGNHEQGYFAIGYGGLTCNGSRAIGNGTHGIESKNASSISADSLITELNTGRGVTTTAGNIVLGNGASCINNLSGVDTETLEGGVISAAGANDIGIVVIDEVSGALLIRPDGTVQSPQNTVIENQNLGKARTNISSLGDVNFGFDPANTGAFTDKIRMKTDGVIHPVIDGSAGIGRSNNFFNKIYGLELITKSPDGTLWVIDVDNAGAVSASLA